MWRRALLGLLLFGAGLSAAPYTPPVEPEPKASPNAWFAKRAGAAIWCAFSSRKAADAALASGDYDTDERAIIWHNGARIQAIMVANESEEAFADDVYYLDRSQRVTRMVRTGHDVDDPLFSVTFMPDWTGRLVLTPAAREAVRLMEQADYEPPSSNGRNMRATLGCRSAASSRCGRTCRSGEDAHRPRPDFTAPADSR